jgi:hypothetical protein
MDSIKLINNLSLTPNAHQIHIFTVYHHTNWLSLHTKIRYILWILLTNTLYYVGRGKMKKRIVQYQ